jgi:hypothetical protein
MAILRENAKVNKYTTTIAFFDGDDIEACTFSNDKYLEMFLHVKFGRLPEYFFVIELKRDPVYEI